MDSYRKQIRECRKSHNQTRNQHESDTETSDQETLNSTINRFNQFDDLILKLDTKTLIVNYLDKFLSMFISQTLNDAKDQMLKKNVKLLQELIKLPLKPKDEDSIREKVNSIDQSTDRRSTKLLVLNLNQKLRSKIICNLLKLQNIMKLANIDAINDQDKLGIVEEINKLNSIIANLSFSVVKDSAIQENDFNFSIKGIYAK